MQISEIYKKYQINKGLQEHMIRVAAVAKTVCRHSQLPIDEEEVVSACLLHDMGNLIKAKLGIASQLFEPEGIRYWKEVQKEMILQYGDVHTATDAMIINVTEEGSVIAKIVAAASLNCMQEVQEFGSLEVKLLEYADMRVGLHGIISMDDRFEDIRNRYVPDKYDDAYIDARKVFGQLIENELFNEVQISPSDITDESTKDMQIELYSFDISPTK